MGVPRGPRAPIDERAFHRWLARTAPESTDRLPALSDDVAALPVRAGLVLLTTDAFCEGTHFTTASPPREVGRALVEVNLSDLASKGAEPVGFLLDLLVPPGTPTRWATEVVRGVRAALRPHGAPLLGGDTKPASRPTLVGTALGWRSGGELPGRHRAQAGDLVAVTGTVGRGGLAALRSRAGSARSRGRSMLAMRARVREGIHLAPVVHAMIDTSDGLYESAHLIAEASHCRVLLDPAALPLDPGLLRAIRSPARLRAVAGFGGDYELLATLPPAAWGGARDALERLGCPLTVIGSVRAGRGAFWQEGGRARPLPRAGWDPFHPRLPSG
jgi:thiamine-monophosphate kinase